MSVVAYALLIAAILSEVAGTLSLRVAARGRTVFYLAVVAGYAVAFTLLSFSLRHGMPLGIAYGVWSATGVALTAVACRWLFEEPLNRRMAAGITLIVAGVLLVELGAA